MKKTWFCAQIGSREHYAVPRVLQRQGQLAALYTDFWAGAFVRGLTGVSGAQAVRSLAMRFHPDLAAASVTAWNVRSLVEECRLRRHKNGSVHQDFIAVGAAFAMRVRETLKRRSDLNSDAIFFAYDTGALETLTWCRDQNIKCILNQMDPSRMEMETVRAEERAWPGWALSPLEIPEEYLARREREWALADRVVVNSEFCRQALLQQGVPAGKLVVIPLCYEAEAAKKEDGKWKMEDGETALRSPLSSTLRVLFLGQVIVRKGIHYLTEAARLLKAENIHFDVVGPIGISAEAVASAPRNLTFHGRATRDQAGTWYDKADLFVLPTLSDGFAITQLEAMAHGLPVVATPCCGEVVSDGVDGFVVPARDAAELARTFQRYLAQPDLLPTQSAAALVKAGQFSLERLAVNLASLESKLMDH